MKALFISYNQAMTERIAAMLDEVGIRGYTLFPLTRYELYRHRNGRGREGGARNEDSPRHRQGYPTPGASSFCLECGLRNVKKRI